MAHRPGHTNSSQNPLLPTEIGPASAQFSTGDIRNRTPEGGIGIDRSLSSLRGERDTLDTVGTNAAQRAFSSGGDPATDPAFASNTLDRTANQIAIDKAESAAGIAFFEPGSIEGREGDLKAAQDAAQADAMRVAREGSDARQAVRIADMKAFQQRMKEENPARLARMSFKHDQPHGQKAQAADLNTIFDVTKAVTTGKAISPSEYERYKKLSQRKGNITSATRLTDSRVLNTVHRIDKEREKALGRIFDEIAGKDAPSQEDVDDIVRETLKTADPITHELIRDEVSRNPPPSVIAEQKLNEKIIEEDRILARNKALRKEKADEKTLEAEKQSKIAMDALEKRNDKRNKEASLNYQATHPGTNDDDWRNAGMPGGVFSDGTDVKPIPRDPMVENRKAMQARIATSRAGGAEPTEPILVKDDKETLKTIPGMTKEAINQFATDTNSTPEEVQEYLSGLAAKVEPFAGELRGVNVRDMVSAAIKIASESDDKHIGEVIREVMVDFIADDKISGEGVTPDGATTVFAPEIIPDLKKSLQEPAVETASKMTDSDTDVVIAVVNGDLNNAQVRRVDNIVAKSATTTGAMMGLATAEPSVSVVNDDGSPRDSRAIAEDLYLSMIGTTPGIRDAVKDLLLDEVEEAPDQMVERIAGQIDRDRAFASQATAREDQARVEKMFPTPAERSAVLHEKNREGSSLDPTTATYGGLSGEGKITSTYATQPLAAAIDSGIASKEVIAVINESLGVYGNTPGLNRIFGAPALTKAQTEQSPTIATTTTSLRGIHEAYARMDVEAAKFAVKDGNGGGPNTKLESNLADFVELNTDEVGNIRQPRVGKNEPQKISFSGSPVDQMLKAQLAHSPTAKKMMALAIKNNDQSLMSITYAYLWNSAITKQNADVKKTFSTIKQSLVDFMPAPLGLSRDTPLPDIIDSVVSYYSSQSPTGKAALVESGVSKRILDEVWKQAGVLQLKHGVVGTSTKLESMATALHYRPSAQLLEIQEKLADMENSMNKLFQPREDRETAEAAMNEGFFRISPSAQRRRAAFSDDSETTTR